MVSSVKLAELWQRLGFRVVVACMGHKQGQESKGGKVGKGSKESVEHVSETLTIYRKKDFFVPDPWNYGIAFGFFGLVRRIIREEHPDLVVINKLLFWTSLSAIPLTFSGRRPIVLTDTFVGITWWPRAWFPRIGAAIYAWTAGWLILLCASRVVLFHPQPEKILKRLRIAKKTEVIPTGIDPAPYAGPKATHDGVVVTYVGRLESVKGVEDFLAAATALQNEVPLTIQAVGWYKEQHPLVEQYRDRVSFTGLQTV